MPNPKGFVSFDPFPADRGMAGSTGRASIHGRGSTSAAPRPWSGEADLVESSHVKCGLRAPVALRDRFAKRVLSPGSRSHATSAWRRGSGVWSSFTEFSPQRRKAVGIVRPPDSSSVPSPAYPPPEPDGKHGQRDFPGIGLANCPGWFWITHGAIWTLSRAYFRVPEGRVRVMVSKPKSGLF